MNKEWAMILGLVYTMDHEVGPWMMAFFMVRLDGPTFMVRVLEKIKFTKSLSPSLGVNRVWTKRNDHAPKMNVLIFF
jgi:hypothetical protein